MLKSLYLSAIILLQGIAIERCAAQDTIKPTPQWRPVYHFSPPVNWTNDPNGLIYLNGTYHMYYQHNPFENKWGHMSWGHTTSTDLYNWKDLPVAIPEQVSRDTVKAIFSGSAVWDKDNTSGFCKGKGCLVAIFTVDQPKQKKESQYIAYSNDNGLTFKFYRKDPVIDLNESDFRDPNVFWYAPSKKWVMVVSSLTEHVIKFYSSKNLRDWSLMSSFAANNVGRECPSMVPLAVDGNPQKIKWVLEVCSNGAHGPFMQYFVGDFDGTSFKSDNPESLTLPVDYGDSFYAAIPWRNAPGNRTILIGWLVPYKIRTSPWSGQMSIPRDLSLKTTSEGIRLYQQPTAIIAGALDKHAHGRMAALKDVNLDNKRIELSKEREFNSNAYWITASFKLDKATKVGFDVAVKKDANGKVTRKVTAGYDAVKQELYIDCTEWEKGLKADNNLVLTAPMTIKDNEVKIGLLFDRSSLEIFGNGGQRVITTNVFPDEDATHCDVFGEGNATLENLKIWDLGRK